MQTVVVVGASLAGLRATEAMRRDGYDGRIVLVGAERHLPYDRPPLSKQLLAGKVELEDAACVGLILSGGNVDWERFCQLLGSRAAT